jgi:hypothetical protein
LIIALVKKLIHYKDFLYISLKNLTLRWRFGTSTFEGKKVNFEKKFSYNFCYKLYRFTEDRTKIYIAEIILALEDLHKVNFFYNFLFYYK